MPVKPILQALVLAERVWSLDDGRKAICGTFSKVFSIKPSATPDRSGSPAPSGHRGSLGAPWAYISLTGICGDTELELNFVNLKINRPILSTSIQVTHRDRLDTIEIAVQLPNLSFSESGSYAFDVVHAGEILGSWRVDVEVRSEDQSSNE